MHDIMASDMNIIVNTDGFGERVTYVDGHNDDEREIVAVVNRQPPERMDDVGGNTPLALVTVMRRDVPNPDRTDSIMLAIKPNEQPSKRAVVDVSPVGRNAWLLEVR